MNVCRINGAQRLVERSHECTRRSDQKISMHTQRSYRVWMGLSPSIEPNHANGKSVCMPRRIAQKPQRIVTSPALCKKSSSQQTAAVESAPNGALYLRKSLRVAASGGASEATGEWAGERSAADASLGGVSAGQGRRVNNITTESNTTKTIHEWCTKCTVNTGVTLQQYERVIVRNNLRAPVNTDPTKPIHTASVTGRITGRRGRSQ